MFCFQRYTRLPLRLILSPRGLQQSLSLGINPIHSAVPCLPHDNIVGNRWCDECKKSILLVVCHIPESILWLILQACRPTIRSSNSCQVQAFQDNLWANFWQFSNWFEFLLLELMVIQTGTWNFVKLLHFLVCQFTVSPNTCLSMSFHVAGPRYSFRVRLFPTG